MKFSIVVLTPGPAEGKVIAIPMPQFVIGRDPSCQLRPASILISKRHCALLQRENKVFLRDFGSTNGTFVNDRQIRGEIELLDGDKLRVGPLLFAVRLEATTPPLNRPTPLPPSKTTTQKVAAPPSPAPPEEAQEGSTNEEDAAALLLSLQDSGEPSPNGSVAADGIPEGSTVLDLPKPAESKDAPEGKKKPTGDTSTAAKSILDKYLKRPRPS